MCSGVREFFVAGGPRSAAACYLTSRSCIGEEAGFSPTLMPFTPGGGWRTSGNALELNRKAGQASAHGSASRTTNLGAVRAGCA